MSCLWGPALTFYGTKEEWGAILSRGSRALGCLALYLSDLWLEAAFTLSSCISSKACVLAAHLSCQALPGHCRAAWPRGLYCPWDLESVWAVMHHGARHRLPKLDPFGQRPPATQPFIPGLWQWLYVDGPSVSSFPSLPRAVPWRCLASVWLQMLGLIQRCVFNLGCINKEREFGI